jgi:hypothetical protein
MDNKTEVILKEAEEKVISVNLPFGLGGIKHLLLNIVWLLKSYNERLIALEQEVNNER